MQKLKDSPDSSQSTHGNRGFLQLEVEEGRSVKAWLTEQLIAYAHAKLGQGGHVSSQVPLSEVFVDLPVVDSASANRDPSERLYFLRQLTSSPMLDLREVFDVHGDVGSHSLGEIRNEPSWRKPIAPSQLRFRNRNFSACLLIGGPGQGKSTLGQLACQLHRASLLLPFRDELTSHQREFVDAFCLSWQQEEHQSPICTLPQLTKTLFPLQVSLPDLATWLSGHQSDLAPGIPAVLQFLCNLASAKKADLKVESLAKSLRSMESLLVLDGFDEVGSSQDRDMLISATRELLHYLAKFNQRVQIVATTRPQGYAGEFDKLGVGLRHCYLAALKKEEALEYASRLVASKLAGVDEQEKTLRVLRDAAAESATENLLKTPLQVTILTALVQYGRAPRERWKLFERYFSITYDREIDRQTYASQRLADYRSHIERIHSRVALLLQVESEKSGGAAGRMGRDRFLQVIDSVLREDEIRDDERAQLVSDIAIAAEQRLVFLVEPEPGLFGFEIRSLQEFLAAWELTSGRDAEVEDRLSQVSTAPMFRNVVMFAASRLFSEASAIRDVFAEKICANLNREDAGKPWRAIRAGSALALEALEEGTVLAQPKRAKSLMQIATGVLDLPPTDYGVRLVHVSNVDTELILRESIETKLINIQRSASEESFSAWACLVEMTNQGDSWALKIGDAYWNDKLDVSKVAQACMNAGVELGDWIASKFDAASERIVPSSFCDCQVPAIPREQCSRFWSSWLATVEATGTPWKAVVGHSSLKSNEIRQALLDFEPLGSKPDSWKVDIALAEFQSAPSKQRLADALRLIAENVPQAEWDSFRLSLSWPIIACLRYAASTAHLARLAETAEAGGLGDVDDWDEAQAAWTREFDPIQVLESVSEELPWTINSLKLAPPILVIDHWYFWGTDPSRPTPRFVRDVLSKSAELFRSMKSPRLRSFLAHLCLQSAKRRVKLQLTQYRQDFPDWLDATGNAIDHLIPKPSLLTKSEWLARLDTSGPGGVAWWDRSPSDIFQSLKRSQVHSAVLAFALRGLDFHGLHLAEEYAKSLGDVSENAQFIRPIADQSSEERAARAIMAIAYGVAKEEDDAQFALWIKEAETANPRVWAALVGAVTIGPVAPMRASALLVQGLESAASRTQVGSILIDALVSIIQNQKSGLENLVVWNRLGLPNSATENLNQALEINALPDQPIVIDHIHLQDVRGFADLLVNLTPPAEGKGQWTVLIGPNGSGKTTILRSMILAARNVKDPSIWPRGAFSEGWQRVPADGERVSESRIAFQLASEQVYETFIPTLRPEDMEQVPRYPGARAFPIFAYGCRRGSALSGASRALDLGDDNGPEVATLFDDQAGLIHAETWLIQLDGDAPKSAQSQHIFNAVTEAMCDLLGLTRVWIEERRVWVKEEGKPALPLACLSDGYLTSAGWLIDLIARWLTLAGREQYPITSDFMSEMRGLVLIDEIDLHLHPQWQIEIISKTRKLFPQLSFLVTTHSPLTLVGAKAEEIRIIARSGEDIRISDGPEDPMLLTGGQLYRQYFAIRDMYPGYIGRKVQRYSFLCGYALRTDDEQQELENLREQLKQDGIELEWEEVARIPVGRAVSD
ncbi:AAA family ATPase [Paraburkholderia sp. BL17N1]|uniref:AAA family ATPase n=1 Tax=Paraburkholderia sp. BL17N1 TaxID=1938798 RepID=UPI000EADBEA0|nr:AAA family ATPase [Paraburkholderia sp. BL17N1]RKR43245.1 putative AbiEii toxin of type IV toxin-antitoxin system [Paraburkholderia sp. BL17N1]